MPDEWIRQWGDPTLHEPAAAVERLDDVLRRQAERMSERLCEAEGIGLAATQVGLMRRLFVYRASAEAEPRALVNPRVASRSAERATFLEGCLSFQAVTVAVERSVGVRVLAHDLDGAELVLEAEGHGASLLQHEIDHLDGILTLDRADAAERRRALATLAHGEPALAA